MNNQSTQWIQSPSIPTNTQDNHKEYTSFEWTNLEYFNEVIKYLKEKNVKSFIDLGGCTGEVSNIILEKVPTVEYGLIFEPYPNNYQYILENVSLDKVKVENKAVFYGKETLTLSIDWTNIGAWSFLFAENHPEKSFDVECVSLDPYLEEKEYDFIKIDIEGSEYNILENSKLLREVKFIELEIHYEHFERYQKQNNLTGYDSAYDFVLKHLPDHEVYYFCCRQDWEVENNTPGNVFLVKKS